jgi:hypothetical protein
MVLEKKEDEIGNFFVDVPAKPWLGQCSSQALAIFLPSLGL